MPVPGRSEQSDDAFLDEVVDQVVARLEEGLPVECAELAVGRSHLVGQIEDLVRLAQQVVVGHAGAFPKIPNYTILSELGHGGMGAVYLAQQDRLGGRPVALKLLPAWVSISPGLRDRFRSEARVIARLNHPNIVAIHDVVDEGGIYAYAMEWVDGRSLADDLGRLVRLQPIHARPATCLCPGGFWWCDCRNRLLRRFGAVSF